MRYRFADLSGLEAEDFDTIIDVRSPSEFAHDRVPGAISLPVLSDAERAEVGTIYTQDSPFRARKIGAALVAKNAATHIQTTLADKPGGWRPLIYCWRGGQRSGAFAIILEQIGWRVAVLEGGYRAWRRHVVDALYKAPLPHRLIRLDGYTGTGKTAILSAVAEKGGQTLDLERLACHRGSILGDLDGPQPSQKHFETALVEALTRLDPARPVLVEAESARIGDLRLPPMLWAAMKGSPRIVIDAPLASRAAFLADRYQVLVDQPDRLRQRFQALLPLVGRDAIAAWDHLLQAGEAQALARALVQDHYDPAYARLRKSQDVPVLDRLELPDLSQGSFEQAATQILQHMKAL